MSPVAAPSTTSCVATQRWFSVWPPRCMPAACPLGTSRTLSPTSRVAACSVAARSARFSGNNTRLSRTVTSVTFRSCACFWTGSTNRCAPTASPRSHPVRLGHHPGRPEGSDLSGLGQQKRAARPGSSSFARPCAAERRRSKWPPGLDRLPRSPEWAQQER